MSQYFIRIVKVPPGEAPWTIREKWVGLELPLAEGRSDVYQVPGVGILSGQPTPEPCIGYLVSAEGAIAVLEHRSADAAAWWRKNAPGIASSGKSLVFPEYVCEKVNSISPNQSTEPTSSIGTPPAGQETFRY
jgi:hypothetical protein